MVGPKETSRPRTRKELEDETRDPRLARRVIDTLVGARLLTIRPNPSGAADWVEIAHEIVINHWERLACWLSGRLEETGPPPGPPQRPQTVAPSECRRVDCLRLLDHLLDARRGDRLPGPQGSGRDTHGHPTEAPANRAPGARRSGAPPQVVVVQNEIVRETLREIEKHFREVIVERQPPAGETPGQRPGPAGRSSVLWEQIRVQLEPRLQQIFQTNQTSLAAAFITNWNREIVPLGLRPQDQVCHCTEHNSRDPRFVRDCATPEQVRTIVTTVIRDADLRPPRYEGQEMPYQKVNPNFVRWAFENLEKRLDREFGEVTRRLPSQTGEASRPRVGRRPTTWARATESAGSGFRANLIRNGRPGRRRSRT